MKKLLYSFVVPKKEFVDDVSISKDESGNEVKTVKKVEKEVLVPYHLYQPTRNIVDEAELFYGVKVYEGIQKGLMPKAFLIRMYASNGGILAESETKQYNEIYKELAKVKREIQEITIKGESQTDEDKQKLIDLESRMMQKFSELQVYEQSKNELLEHTAENWAKNKTIIWWMLTLAAKEVNGKIEDFFPGETSDEKMKFIDNLEEKDDFTTKETLSLVKKFMYLTGAWYSGKANTKEQFDEILNELNEPQSQE